MPGKVTDPAILAELDKPVTDPALLAELDGTKPSGLQSLDGTKPSGLQSFGAGVAQGATLNFGDEVEGGIQALLRKYIERDPDAAGKTLGELYASERDYRRKENQRAQEANRGAYLGGNVAGGLLTAPLVPGGAVAQGGSKLLQAAKIGAGYGALTGAGRAESVGDMPGTMLTDAAVGAVAGPLVQYGGAKVAEGARQVASEGLSPVFQRIALNQGRKALTGNAGTIAVKRPLSPEAVAAAYETGAIRPGAGIKGISERLGDARDVVGQQYGDLIDALAKAGITGPRANKLAIELSDQGRQMVQAGNPGPEMFAKAASEVAGEPAAMATGALPLNVAETIKRNFQNAARAEYVKEGPTSLAGSAKKDIASYIRQSIEDAVDQQAAKAPQEAAAFVPVKRRLGALIEADTAAGAAAARDARKSAFGLIPTVAASGGLASGGVGTAAAAGALAKAMQSRGPATVGSIANFIANRLPAMAAGSPSPAASGAVSAEIRALIEALTARGAGVRFAPAGAEENK